MTGWTQHSLVFNSCVIHPASCLRGGGKCLRLGWTFKSFCFKKMDLLFQFPLLPCSPFSKSNKCYEKSCWTIENQKETFRWALPPPPKIQIWEGKSNKTRNSMRREIGPKQCFLDTARQLHIWTLSGWEGMYIFPEEMELLHTLWLRNEQYLHSCDVTNTGSLRHHPQTKTKGFLMRKSWS